MRSKHSFLKAYLVVVFAFGFFLALGLLLILVISKKTLPDKSPFILYVFGSFCIFMSIYTLYSYMRQIPSVIIDSSGITFRSPIKFDKILWNQIESVKCTGKAPFRFLFRHPLEAIHIFPKNGKPIYIFDHYFSNISLIKRYIRSYFEKNEAPVIEEIKKVTKSEIRFEKFNFVKRNALFSLRGLTVWALLLFFVFSFIKNPQNMQKGIIPIISMFTFYYLVTGYLCHYFGFSEKYLLVQNHFLPWINRRYRYQDIMEVVFESRVNMPNCLRVITSSYKTKLFPAAPLKKSDWLEIKKILKSKNIKVRNESV